jgi:8-oxo-dGTP diphosphatase
MLKVTCALIIEDNRILITQNNINSDHPLQWEFPGGKVKKNEVFEDCIKREIKEELDIEIQILKTLEPAVFDYGIKKIELIPFLCSIKKGNIRLKVHKDLEWISFKKLGFVNLSGADRALIEIEENRKILKEYIGK